MCVLLVAVFAVHSSFINFPGARFSLSLAQVYVHAEGGDGLMGAIEALTSEATMNGRDCTHDLEWSVDIHTK